MSGRHTGGTLGTRSARTDCPVCGRSVSGGNMNRERTQIRLRRHKRVADGSGLREWCQGGGQVVFWR